MGSTSLDQLAPRSSTRVFLWTLVLLLSSSVTQAGITEVICDAAAAQTNPALKPSCNYAEGDNAWIHTNIVIGGDYPNTASDFLTGLIYTMEGCLADEGLNFGDPVVNCSNRAAAVKDYAPIVIENDGQHASISYSSSGRLNYIPIELVDDCDVEGNEVFSVYTRPQPFATSGPQDGVEVVIVDNDDDYFLEFKSYDVVAEIGTKTTLTFTVKRRGVLGAKTIEYSTSGITIHSPQYFIEIDRENIVFQEDDESQTAEIEIKPAAIETKSESETKGPKLFSFELFFPADSDPLVCTGKIAQPSKAYVRIHEPGTTLFCIEQCDYSVTESDSSQTFTFKIIRKGNLDRTSNIEYSIKDLSTKAGSDYISPQTQLVTFAPATGDQDDAEVSITINADKSTEHPETFELSLKVADEEGVVTSPAKAIVTILDYSTTKSCVQFESDVHSVLESDGSVDLTLVRTGNVEDSIIVDLQVTDMDAIFQEDYIVPSPFRVSFDSEQTKATTSLRILDNQRKENTKTFKVTLQESSGSSDKVDICSYEAKFSIKNDDDQFYLEGRWFVINEGDKITVGILRCGYLGKVSTVRVRVTPGSSISSDDYDIQNVVPAIDASIQFAVNQDFHLLEITANDDDVYEDDEEFTVELLPGTNAIDDQIGIPNQAKIIITSDDAVPVISNLQNFARPATTVKMVVDSLTIVERPPGTPLVFTDDLYDSSSALYKELEEEIETELAAILSYLPGFRYVVVLFFSPGSVVVTFEVGIDIESTTDLSDVNKLLQHSINHAGVLSGGNFKLDPAGFTHPAGGSSAYDNNFIGVILGGITGAAVFLLLIIIAVCHLVRKRSTKKPINQAVDQHQPVQQVNTLSYHGTN